MKPLTDYNKSLPIAGKPERRRRCRHIRLWLAASLGRRLGPEANWVQRHAAGCPRCQKRIAALGRVDLALSLVKSQPHHIDLLKRANTHAIGMLKHSLRDSAQARLLENFRPELSFLERSAGYRHQLANVAACVAIVALTRIGLFSSLDRATTQGAEHMRQYYAMQIGEDLAGEIFDA